MHSERIINRMMIEWQYPIDLTHLNIKHCQILNDWNIIDSLINNIWSLNKLTHCYLDINVIDEDYSIVPTIISLSLECLSIKNLRSNVEELIHLFKFTPRLRYLDIAIKDESDNQILLSPLPLITTLKFSYEGPFNVLKLLLENMPNLSHLAMRTENICVEGDQWADIIDNHLHQLKVFYLLMKFNRHSHAFWLYQLIETYKTLFWLEKHKWDVQGYSYNTNPDVIVYLYIVPYMFDDYHISSDNGSLNSTWTCLDNYGYISADHVHDLSCDSLPTNTYQLRQRFPNVHHLTLKLPFQDSFWFFLPTFYQLRVLDISLFYKKAYNQDASFQLQTLLGRAPKLYALAFHSSIDSLLPLLECMSASVFKLDLNGCTDYFNYTNCDTLCLSSLGKQCEILSIKVEDRMNIIQLVKEMSYLRSLNVECPPDKYKSDFSLPCKDQLILWLKYQLPSTCAITRDSSHPDRIQLWIR
jgi:hypothetical protein